MKVIVKKRQQTWQENCRKYIAFAMIIIYFMIAPPSLKAQTETKPLLFLGNQNLAPVVYNKDGHPTGLAVDIVRSLGKKMNRDITIICMDWAKAQELVAAGEADALIQINPTEERLKKYDFSETLLQSQFSIFTLNSRTGITDVSSLRDLRVGVERGGFPHKVLQEDELIQLVIVKNFLEGFDMVSKGQLDAVVVDYIVGSYVLAENKINTIKISGEPIAYSQSAIAVKKGNKELLSAINDGLKKIMSDGTYSLILSKWEPKEVIFLTREQILNRIYLVIFSVLILLCLVAIAWIITIKRELKKRRLSENELRTKSEELELFFSTAIDLLCIADIEGNFLRLNKQWEETLGHSIDEIKKHKFFDYVHPDDLDSTIQAVSELKQNKRVFNFINRYLNSDGAYRWIEWRSSPYGNYIYAAARDISDRIHTEEKLKEQYATVHGIIESVNALLFSVDRQYRYTNFNKRHADVMRTIYGVEIEIGRSLLYYMTVTEDRATAKKNLDQALAGRYLVEEAFSGQEVRSRRYFQVSHSPIKTEDEEIIGVAMLAYDITERKMAEQNLALMNFALNTMHEAAFLTDKNGRFLFVNEEATRGLGYTRDELMTMSVYDIDPNITKGRWLDHWNDLKKRSSLTFEVYHKAKKGRLIPMEINTNYFEFDGQSYILALTRDITERRRAEEALLASEKLYRSVMDQAADAFFILDNQGLIVDANKTAEQNLGYQREELLSLNIHDIDPLVIPGGHKETFWEHLGKDQSFRFESRHRRKNGSEFPVEVNLGPLELSDRKLMLGLSRDISERKQQDNERLERLRFMENLNRFNRTLQKSGDLNQMMKDVLDDVLEMFDCDRCYLLYPCDPEAPTWSVPMERTKPEWPGAGVLAEEIPMDDDVALSLRILLSADGPVRFDPESEWPLPAHISAKYGIKSFMAMAVYPKIGKPWQLGIHQCSFPRVWKPEEERLFLEMGRRLADALGTLLSQRNLSKSEEKLVKLFKVSPVPYYLTSRADGRFLDFNDAFLRYTGLEREEVEGRSIMDLGPWIEPGHQPQTFEMLERNGRLRDSEETFLTKNGQRKHCIRSTEPIEIDGQECLLHVTVDITERRRAEEALRNSEEKWFSFFQFSPVWIILTTLRDGRLLDVNEAFLRGTGYIREDLIGRSIRYIGFQNFPEERYNTLVKKLLADGELHDIELDLRLKNGEEIRTVLWSMQSVEVDGQLCLLSHGLDITDRKRIEEETRRRQEELVQADRLISLGVMVAGMAHEINNPNNTILLNASILSEAWKDMRPFLETYYQEQGEFRLAGMLYSELRGNLSGILDGIITGSRRIEQIIKHLKEYARQGAVESTQDVDANQVIQSTLTLLAPQIRKATHALRIELEDDLPPVRGNFGRLEQVLVNLVQNACQALPDPGKELVIRSAYHPSDGTVEIVVQDEGIGIPSEILENVRAPFVTTKREQGGLGLGLSIASTIVDEHNGRLDLVSKIGQGTRAIVQLPISHGR